MDISPVISSSSLQNIFATTSSQRVVFSIITPAVTTSTSVDISGLGRLLSAASVLERSVSTTAGSGNAGFPTVLATTQLFVDAFNGFLQSGSLQNASGTPVASQFVQTVAGGQLDRLSGIGISYQPYSDQNPNGQLVIDYQTLQSAFNADRNGTVSLLAQATQSIGQSATQFTGHLAQMDILAQISNSQSYATVQQTGSKAQTAAGNALPGEATAPAATAAIPAAIVTEGGSSVAAVAAGSTSNWGVVAETPFASVSTAEIPSAQVAVEANIAASAVVPGTVPETLAASLTGETAVSITTETPSAAAQAAASIGNTGVAVTTSGAPQQAIVNPALSVVSDLPAQFSAESVVIPATVETSAAATTATTLQTPAASATEATGAAAISTAATPPAVLTAAQTATAAATLAATAAPSVANQAAVNSVIDASNPAIAAAIAAYHMVDGIFDTAWPHDEGITPAMMGYSEILPVAPTQSAKLNLHA